jgi:hypothetical protein
MKVEAYRTFKLVEAVGRESSKNTFESILYLSGRL